MTITIKCECGNEVKIPVPSKKYIQFRDNLEANHFYFTDTEYDKQSRIKEIRIQCNKCGNYVSLGLD